jgi:hypothetical protein
MGDPGDDASVTLHGILEDTVWTEFYLAAGPRQQNSVTLSQ